LGEDVERIVKAAAALVWANNNFRQWAKSVREPVAP
jgi:hypothetical protein